MRLALGTRLESLAICPVMAARLIKRRPPVQGSPHPGREPLQVNVIIGKNQTALPPAKEAPHMISHMIDLLVKEGEPREEDPGSPAAEEGTDFILTNGEARPEIKC
ncbi:hypothetical protein [Nitrosovibrio sp. Nv6]|uniref:hypothetical protein n=1 Tax=Nitrosovibrio sp. Nv6 TaxID=1855340 RepID=UPI0008D7961C|nr:hypothetical protein [Nitrosovibrio sp. Nv6]SEO54425.1 hypothetical protein SAMN05216316_0455 [Nitrosovibrio sp. Nv6]